MENKTFKLFGNDIEFSAAQLTYYYVRNKFAVLADFSQNEAKKNFYTRFSDFSSMTSGITGWMNKYINNGCDLAIQILAEYDCYDIDSETFKKSYVDFSDFNKAVKYLKDFIRAQEAERNEAENRRSERSSDAKLDWKLKEGANDAVDGDDDVKIFLDGVSGVALAGLFNAAGRMMESSRQGKEQEQFFKSGKTTAIFRSAIYNTIANMYIGLFKYMEENCPDVKVEYLSQDAVDKSEALFANIQKGIVPEDKITELCRRIVTINPLHRNIFEYIFENYPEESLNLQKLDDYFGVEVMPGLLNQKMQSFYSTLPVDTEENAMKAKEEMENFAEKLQFENYDTLPELKQLLEQYDKEYRTVEGTVYETRDEADKYKELWRFFNSLNYSGTFSGVTAEVDKVHNKAAELSVSDDCLKPFIEKKFAECQQNALKKLDDYYGTLDLSTEEKAVAAVKLVNEKAAELEVQDFSSYQPLTDLLTEFDKKARSVADRIFETRNEAALQRQAYAIYKESSFCQSMEDALKTKDSLVAFQTQHNIDISWLITDVDQAITHYDELLKTKFDYRYNSYEECKNAVTDARLFFRAIWSAIYKYAKKNNIKQWNELSEKVQGTVRTTLGLSSDTEVFLYISTEMLGSGNSGMAFTSAGLAWSNGSALVSKALDNKLVKSLFSKVKAASDLQEKFKINSHSVSWQEFFNTDTNFSGASDKYIAVVTGKNFEADFINVQALRELLGKLKNYASDAEIEFSNNNMAIERSSIQGDLQFTPLPDLR